MEGVTDAPMRATLTEYGGYAFTVTDFLRITHSVLPPRVYREHMPEILEHSRTRTGAAVQLQLLGGDPERIARSARVATDLGVPAIDLNFGCPAPTVNRHDGGAALLKYPDRIRGIVAAVRAAVPRTVPVSAKLRLGFDTIDAIDLNAERAAEGGADWITIHARTKAQFYRPPVYWEAVTRVRKNLSIPVVVNGDIHSFEDFERCRDETGCEHYMLGRGALSDPYLALRIAESLGVSRDWKTSKIDFVSSSHAFESRDPAIWSAAFTRFTEWCEKSYPDMGRGTLNRVKQWLNLASRARPVPWFDEIKRAQTLAELHGILRETTSLRKSN